MTNNDGLEIPASVSSIHDLQLTNGLIREDRKIFDKIKRKTYLDKWLKSPMILFWGPLFAVLLYILNGIVDVVFRKENFDDIFNTKSYESLTFSHWLLGFLAGFIMHFRLDPIYYNIWKKFLQEKNLLFEDPNIKMDNFTIYKKMLEYVFTKDYTAAKSLDQFKSHNDPIVESINQYKSKADANK